MRQQSYYEETERWIAAQKSYLFQLVSVVSVIGKYGSGELLSDQGMKGR